MAPRKKTDQPAKSKSKPKSKDISKSKPEVQNAISSENNSQTTQQRKSNNPTELCNILPKRGRRSYPKFKSCQNRYKITRASLYDNNITEKSIEERISKLPNDSPSKITWGRHDIMPILGTTRRKGGVTLKYAARRSKGTTYVEMVEDMRKTPNSNVAKSSTRLNILKLPMEIRHIIYSFLLICPEPIMLKSDLISLEKISRMSNSILFTCKQLSIECSAFVYRSNEFKILIRNATRFYAPYEDKICIKKSVLQDFKNVVLDFSRDSWNINGLEQAIESIYTLIEARPNLHSLTLILIPQLSYLSTTLHGSKKTLTSADLFCYRGRFMEIVRHLAPKEFKVIMKKIDSSKTIERRLMMSIDLKYLYATKSLHPELVNDETIKLAMKRADAVEKQLIGLEARFQEVYENDNAATKMGKCELLYSGALILPSP